MKSRDYTLVETRIRLIKSKEIENKFTEEELNIMNKVLRKARRYDRAASIIHNMSNIGLVIGMFIGTIASTKYIIIPYMNFEESDNTVVFIILALMIIYMYHDFIRNLVPRDEDIEDDEDEE